MCIYTFPSDTIHWYQDTNGITSSGSDIELRFFLLIFWVQYIVKYIKKGF